MKKKLRSEERMQESENKHQNRPVAELLSVFFNAANILMMLAQSPIKLFWKKINI